MKVSFYLFFLSFVYSLNCYGQLSIFPTWNKKPLELQHVYLNQNNDSISFSSLKIYFSDFRFKDKISGRITSIEESHALLTEDIKGKSKEHTVIFADIKRATVEIEFNRKGDL